MCVQDPKTMVDGSLWSTAVHLMVVHGMYGGIAAVAFQEEFFVIQGQQPGWIKLKFK